MKRAVAVQPPDCDMAIGCCDREEIAAIAWAFVLPPPPAEAAATMSRNIQPEQDGDCDPPPKDRPPAKPADYRF
ncbi:MAG: hypothetical protein DI595_17210 [Agrobacterium fabrum]|uniref:Uncharacterized protein n=1 Tax=Agrobacterium fabrum TaxID=1176649 RepID=A0A2W5EZH3_9HYPH|nr:MAG: hypothetical protein DI595_17210 [Agrobacterium fabrum]